MRLKKYIYNITKAKITCELVVDQLAMSYDSKLFDLLDLIFEQTRHIEEEVKNNPSLISSYQELKAHVQEEIETIKDLLIKEDDLALRTARLLCICFEAHIKKIQRFGSEQGTVN